MVEMADDDDDVLAMLGALRADDDDDLGPDEPCDGDDLALHVPVSSGNAEPVAKPEDAWIDMGTRAIARSAEGLTVMNTLEILPPFELSV